MKMIRYSSNDRNVASVGGADDDGKKVKAMRIVNLLSSGDGRDWGSMPGGAEIGAQ